MKKSFIAVVIAAVFAACTTNPKTGIETATTVSHDTTGLAQFQAWKNQQNKDNAAVIETQGVYSGMDAYTSATPAPNNVIRTYENNEPRYSAPAPVRRKSTATRTASSRGTSRAKTSTGTSNSGSSTGSNETGGTVAQAPVPAKKKGWSSAAKGAVIGGAAGAIGGAVLSKNKAKGAVIGGILGAGGGYVFGRSQDKKTGRY